MENAVDALKMAFAILVFLIALALTFFLFTKIKETTDTMLWYADRDNFTDYEYESLKNGREVGVDTVISTLKNYKKQSSYVKIEKNGITQTFDYSESSAAAADAKIAELLQAGNRRGLYYETIEEITTGGEFYLAEDGTRLQTDPTGEHTRRYIVYKWFKNDT